MNLSKENLKKINSLNEQQTKELNKIIKVYVDNGGQVGNGFISKALDVAKNISNKITGCKDKEEKWDYKPKSGENHTIITKSGCQYRGRFAGPGTHVIADVKELLKMNDNNISMAVKKDNFASDVDRLGMAHDIRYVLATNLDLDKDEKNEYIRKADEKFIRDGKKLPDQINSLIPTKAIEAKLIAENIKVKAGGNRNAGNEKASKEDVELLEKVLAHLEQIGFGLREKVVKQMNELKDLDKQHNTDFFMKKIYPITKFYDIDDLNDDKKLNELHKMLTIVTSLLIGTVNLDATTKKYMETNAADMKRIQKKVNEERKDQSGDGVVNDAKDYIGNLIAKAAKAYFNRKSGKGEDMKERPLRGNGEDKYDNILKLMNGKQLL